MGKLEDLRARIDAIDEAILRLLEQRANVAEQAAEAKREAGAISYYDPERERAVLDRLARKGAGKFPAQAIGPVFREIMSGCLSLQTPITVVFLGPEGAFSHMAARHSFGLAARYRESATIQGVFDAVRRGDAISGVVPVESSSEGSITHALEALVEGDLFIRQELILEASQCLIGRGSQLSVLERVYAHPRVLAECQLWLARNLAGVQIVHTSSTSSAAREASSDDRSAAIGTRLAAELSGLGILAERIQDRADSAIRFVIIAREDAPPTGTDKTTIAFSLQDAAARGALKRALEVFDEQGINLSRIESRPRGAHWEYVFLVDLEGHRLDPAVANVIQTLRTRCGTVRVLGSYPRSPIEVPGSRPVAP